MAPDADEPLQLSPGPELVFGLIAPVGVDLDLITEVLEQRLREMEYKVHRLRLTQLMREVPATVGIDERPYVKSFQDRIAYANKVRHLLGNEALAALAISAIRVFRAEERQRRREASTAETSPAHEPDSDESDEEAPLPYQAYVIRQIKRTEEVAVLRGVYGRQFILVGGYAPQEWRTRRIQEREQQSRGGLISEVEARNLAYELVMQDAREPLDPNGQELGEAFPLADVFIDATSRPACEAMIRRFIDLLFGSNEVTPTHDEYGMYLAKSASLRSSDLSRQVGAAIFRTSGEVVTLGCNEVPKAGGGTYWSGEARDARDFIAGHDPNELRKVEILVDLVDRLMKGEHLSSNLMAISDPTEIGRLLLAEESDHAVRDSRVMDILEFGRIIHAEMSAICDASRKGVAVEGATLYCTTFPCHICATHVVASGIRQVVYLEPYPKSYASALHADSIAVDPTDITDKVTFRAFLGVSPYRYRDLFEKGKRKYSGGLAQKWNRGARRPMIEVYFPSYFKAENRVVSRMRNKLELIVANQQPDPTPVATLSAADQSG